MSQIEQRFAVHRNLIQNLTQFCSLLRANGIKVGIQEEETALKSLSYISIQDSTAFRNTLELCLAKSQEEQKIFQNLFESFWLILQNTKKITHTKEVNRPSKKKKQVYQKKHSILTISDWIHSTKQNPLSEEKESATYCDQESLQVMDFQEIPEQDQTRITQSLNALARKIAVSKSRRFTRSKKNPSLDLKKTFRKNVTNPDYSLLYYRKKKKKWPKFTFLLDVSRSMEIYSFFLLNFLYALKKHLKKTECFLFSTTLKKLEGDFTGQDFDEFCEKMETYFPQWSGGTRLEESLGIFQKEYAHRHTDKNTTLLILSDGWDCGEWKHLASRMQYLQSRSKKVIWLNPLMGFSGFEPKTEGMQTCLPFIDHLLSAHNVQSLEQAFLKIIES